MVGYVFARSELNIATWVHKRLVDVGVMSNLDWDNPRRVPAAFRRDLRVIGETGNVPRALEMVRSDLDPKVEARLRKVLCDAGQRSAKRGKRCWVSSRPPGSCRSTPIRSARWTLWPMAWAAYAAEVE